MIEVCAWKFDLVLFVIQVVIPANNTVISAAEKLIGQLGARQLSGG